jgi:hypothetical protein
MKVEIGAEAAQFPDKEYINGIAVAVYTSSSTEGCAAYFRCNLKRGKCDKKPFCLEPEKKLQAKLAHTKVPFLFETEKM